MEYGWLNEKTTVELGRTVQCVRCTKKKNEKRQVLSQAKYKNNVLLQEQWYN
jgi:hypothetical protein